MDVENVTAMVGTAISRYRSSTVTISCESLTFLFSPVSHLIFSSVLGVFKVHMPYNCANVERDTTQNEAATITCVYSSACISISSRRGPSLLPKCEHPGRCARHRERYRAGI